MDWSEDEDTFAGETIKAALDGVGSEELQLGPREPMKEVFSKRKLFCTVKLKAEVTAIPYPNAPVSVLFRTVPEELTFAPKVSTNHV